MAFEIFKGVSDKFDQTMAAKTTNDFWTRVRWIGGCVCHRLKNSLILFVHKRMSYTSQVKKEIVSDEFSKCKFK